MGAWARGGDRPLVNPDLAWKGAGAVSDDYMEGGRNVASIVNGKLYVYDRAKFDPSTVAGLDLTVATPQEVQQIQMPEKDSGLFGALDRMMPTKTSDAFKLFGSLALGGALSGAAGSGAAGAGSGGMTLSNPWGAGSAIGTSPLSGMAGSVLDMAAPAATGWGSGVGTAAGAAAGGGMDLSGFMSGNPWAGVDPSPWQTLAEGPLGGGSVNFGTAADPYGLGWGDMAPTGSPGWDSIFNGGANLSPGGPWNDFAANPYGSGVPSGNSLLDMVKKALTPGNGGGNGGGGSANGGGDGTSPLMRLLGTGLSAGLGAYSSSQQADTLRELAASQQAAEKARYDDLVRRESERFGTLREREDAAIARQQQSLADILRRESERFDTLRGREDAAIGRQQDQIAFDKGVVAPSQARYEGSFKPGFSMESDPGYMDALNQSSKATLHGLSVNGNPAGSPNAWQATLKDVYEKTAYPALKDYRATNAATGYSGPFATGAATVPGIGTNLTQGVTQNVPGIGTSLPGSASAGGDRSTQAGFDTMAAGIGADGKVWNTIGSALGDVFNPKQSFSLADLAKLYGGGNNIFKVA